MEKTFNPQIQQRLGEFLKAEEEKSDGMTQTALGQKLGYTTGSVLSSYCAGKYMGDVGKLEANLTNFFDALEKRQVAKEQAKALSPVSEWDYVPTSISENVYHAIEYCRLMHKLTILHGDAGIGKTKGVQKYMDDNKGFVLYVRVDESCRTPRTLMDRVARQLGIQSCRNYPEKSARVRQALEESMKVLIVDDAHRLPQRSLESLQDYAEPDLLTRKTGIGIVLIGNTRVMNFISVVRRDDMDQFSSRLLYPVEYRREHIKLDDVKLVFPYLTENRMDKELGYLWSLSKSRGGIRTAVNTYNNAVSSRSSVVYDSLLRASKPGAGLI